MLTNSFTDTNTYINSAVPSVPQKESPVITDSRTGRKIAKQSVNTGIKPCLLKRIAKKISLYYRVIKKCTIISYYFVKHVVFKRPIDTPGKIENMFQKLGPTIVKTIQPLFDNDLFAEVFCHTVNKNYKNLSSEEIKENNARLMKALRSPLTENKCTISKNDAQNILNYHFDDNYTVNETLGVGTIASCFEVTNKDCVKAVAKLVMEDSIGDIEVSKAAVKFMSYLFFMSKGELAHYIISGLQSYIDEGDLELEMNNQSTYKDLICRASSDNEITINNQKVSETSLTLKCSFYVPDIIDRSRGAVVMEKIDGFPLSKLKSPACDLYYLKSKIEKLIGSSLNVDQFNEIMPELVNAITEESKKKWYEVLVKHNIAHGDLHSGNIIVSFDKEITISFLDHPRNIEVDSGLNDFLKTYVEMVNEFTEIQPTKKMKIGEGGENSKSDDITVHELLIHLAKCVHAPSENFMAGTPKKNWN